MGGSRHGRTGFCLLACASLLSAAALNFLPWLFAFWGSSPQSLAEGYGAVFYLQMPALFALEHSPLPALWGWEESARAWRLVAEGERFFARLGHLVLLLVHWTPWAFGLGLAVCVGSRSARAAECGAARRKEQRLLLRGLAWTELPWWVLFLVATPFKGIDLLNLITFMIALPAVKLVQVYLVLRAALFLGISRGKFFLMGLFAGAALLFWVPFLLLNEEFQRVEELDQERRARHEPQETDSLP